MNSNPPDAKDWVGRPVGLSPSQNQFVQGRVAYLEGLGATNIGINQQQATFLDTFRVGINRPDLQYDFGGVRYLEEFDTAISGRGPLHGERISVNDPLGVVLLWSID